MPTWIVTRHGADAARCQALRDCGVELIEVPVSETVEMDLTVAFTELGKRGLTRVLVEGGAGLAAQLLEEGLVDRLAWFHAPMADRRRRARRSRGFRRREADAAPGFRRLSIEAIGEDVWKPTRRLVR